MCSWATSLTVLIIDFLRQFFTTNPLACDPSSLPKYPPSKEIDAKFREEEARRYVLKVVLPSLILNWQMLEVKLPKVMQKMMSIYIVFIRNIKNKDIRTFVMDLQIER